MKISTKIDPYNKRLLPELDFDEMSNFSLFCFASNEEKSVILQWYKNGKAIDSITGPILLSSSNYEKAELPFIGADESMAANYTCQRYVNVTQCRDLHSVASIQLEYKGNSYTRNNLVSSTIILSF